LRAGYNLGAPGRATPVTAGAGGWWLVAGGWQATRRAGVLPCRRGGHAQGADRAGHGILQERRLRKRWLVTM